MIIYHQEILLSICPKFIKKYKYKNSVIPVLICSINHLQIKTNHLQIMVIRCYITWLYVYCHHVYRVRNFCNVSPGFNTTSTTALSFPVFTSAIVTVVFRLGGKICYAYTSKVTISSHERAERRNINIFGVDKRWLCLSIKVLLFFIFMFILSCSIFI